VTWVAVAAALASAPAAPPPLPWAGGRIVTTDTLHVGLRPAAFVDNEDRGALEWGAGATVQVTVRAL
jgi:hypothetical protein